MAKLIRSFFSFFIIGIIIFGCTKHLSMQDENAHEITIRYEPGEPLAKVGDVVLSLNELSEDFVGRQGALAGASALNTQKKKKEYVENQVIQEAMFQEAIKEGYLNRHSVKRDIKKIVVQKMMRDKLKNVAKTYVPTEEEIKEHYKKNLNLYKRDEAIKVAYITIPHNNKKALAKKAAKKMHEELTQDVKHANTNQFARIAVKHAQKHLKNSATLVEANESRYLGKEKFEEKFGPNFDKIKTLKDIGEISPILYSENAYHIVMKKGYRKPLNESIADAKPKIIKRLAFKNRGKIYQDYLDSLHEKYNIKVYENKIAQLGEEILDGIEEKEGVAANNE